MRGYQEEMAGLKARKPRRFNGYAMIEEHFENEIAKLLSLFPLTTFRASRVPLNISSMAKGKRCRNWDFTLFL